MANDDAARSLTSGHRFQWDIFLSFRGEDTRHNFTEKLHNELVRNGVRTFIDNENLDRGKEISPSLLTAIEDSAASIVVISKNYASSKWCLEELAKLSESKRILLLPVFYEVDPSDVRRQKGPFEKDFREHEELVEAEKVYRWREGMKKAGNISGWDSRLWEEAELIQSLVKRVLAKLDNTPLGVAKYPVGLHSRLDELLRILNVKANGVIVLGLYGMGGVGKTTLAKALYNQLLVHFKKRSFISDVKEIARRQNGLVTLQSKLIGDLNSGASPIIESTAEGIQLMKESMNNEPVVIFLDDIDNADQLNALICGRNWFCQGTRVIVTTRDQNVLLPNIVTNIFEVKELSSSESLKLFSYHAFGREQPPKNFSVLAEEVVTLSGGLPLALEIFGSLLFYKKRLKEWQDVVQKLRQIRPGDLQDILEISFTALDEQEKCIFLDLACLLLNTRLEREDAIAIFRGCGFGAESAITELTAKCLLKIVDGNVLWMHDQLKNMGRQIVQRENFGDAGKRSRLWNHDDIMAVLNNHKGTRNIEGIVVDFDNKQDQNSEEVSWIYLKEVFKKYIGQGRTENGLTFHTRAFQCMDNLRLLQINHVKLVGNFKLLPVELKWLQWKGCPLEVIPPELLSRKIAVLDLSESMITQVWNKGKWNVYQNKVSELVQPISYFTPLFVGKLEELCVVERTMCLLY